MTIPPSTIIPNSDSGQFQIEFPYSTIESTGMSESDIVCTVFFGIPLRIRYDYHRIRSRPGTIGPLTQQNKYRFQLTPPLAAAILEGCKNAIFTALETRVE